MDDNLYSKMQKIDSKHQAKGESNSHKMAQCFQDGVFWALTKVEDVLKDKGMINADWAIKTIKKRVM